MSTDPPPELPFGFRPGAVPIIGEVHPGEIVRFYDPTCRQTGAAEPEAGDAR